VSLEGQAVAPVQVCPAAVRFRGLITATTAGLVRYRLRTQDGALTTPSYDLVMNAKEVRAIEHLTRLGRLGDQAARGTLLLEVTGAKGVQTARASQTQPSIRPTPSPQMGRGSMPCLLRGCTSYRLR
jgi:hypothetical protein